MVIPHGTIATTSFWNGIGEYSLPFTVVAVGRKGDNACFRVPNGHDGCFPKDFLLDDEIIIDPIGAIVFGKYGLVRFHIHQLSRQ
eukprot:scaffold16191_cov45-Attheya_sp.AAC.1